MKFFAKPILGAFVALFLLVGGVSAVQAEERGSKEEAVAVVEAVESYFAEHGAEATFAATTDKTNPDFFNKDLYPFIYDLEGHCVAHGAKAHLVGKDLLHLKDQDGKELIKEMVDLAKADKKDWVDFKWPDPLTNAIMDKSAYVVPLGDKYFVGVGIYKD